MNESQSVKSMRGRKKGSSTCQRVVSFCKKLAAFIPSPAASPSASAGVAGPSTTTEVAGPSSAAGVAGPSATTEVTYVSAIRKRAKSKIVKRSAKRNSKRKDNTKCHSCGFAYGAPDDPLLEDSWLTCSICKRWSHESCGKLTKKNYVCNVCC